MRMISYVLESRGKESAFTKLLQCAVPSSYAEEEDMQDRQRAQLIAQEDGQQTGSKRAARPGSPAGPISRSRSPARSSSSAGSSALASAQAGPVSRRPGRRLRLLPVAPSTLPTTSADRRRQGQQHNHSRRARAQRQRVGPFRVFPLEPPAEFYHMPFSCIAVLLSFVPLKLA